MEMAATLDGLYAALYRRGAIRKEMLKAGAPVNAVSVQDLLIHDAADQIKERIDEIHRLEMFFHVFYAACATCVRFEDGCCTHFGDDGPEVDTDGEPHRCDSFDPRPQGGSQEQSTEPR